MNDCDLYAEYIKTAVLLPCPFCGKPGKIFGSNMVGCSDDNNCSANIDFGHWCGEENGITAVHWVVEQWNTRYSPLLEQIK